MFLLSSNKYVVVQSQTRLLDRSINLGDSETDDISRYVAFLEPALEELAL
jgi:hypothetical protein